jgi:hypothetical protein
MPNDCMMGSGTGGPDGSWVLALCNCTETVGGEECLCNPPALLDSADPNYCVQDYGGENSCVPGGSEPSSQAECGG